jgi:hypothetical protein
LMSGFAKTFSPFAGNGAPDTWSLSSTTGTAPTPDPAEAGPAEEGVLWMSAREVKRAALGCGPALKARPCLLQRVGRWAAANQSDLLSLGLPRGPAGGLAASERSQSPAGLTPAS